MSNRTENSVRIAVATLGFVGAAYISPLVPAVCIGLLALRFRAWEAIALGAFVDFMWQPAGSLIVHMPLFTLASIAIVWVLEPLRSEFLLDS